MIYWLPFRIPHPTFVANLIATKYEMCRTGTQRIPTSANVEGHLLLYYFNSSVKLHSAYVHEGCHTHHSRGATLRSQTAPQRFWVNFS